MGFIKFIHVLAAILAIALFVGPEVLVQAVLRSRDVAAIRRVLSAQQRSDPVAIGALLVTLLAGFSTASATGFSLLSGWLIAAYVLSAGIIVLGLAVYAPKAAALLAAAERSPLEAASDELRQEIARPIHAGALVLSAILWTSLIYLMVVKPF